MYREQKSKTTRTDNYNTLKNMSFRLKFNGTEESFEFCTKNAKDNSGLLLSQNVLGMTFKKKMTIE